jgi:formylglycine-generating enzyme required for sulfatase activity
MSDSYRLLDDVTLHTLINQRLKNLQRLEIQAAKYGPMDAPIALQNQIDEERLEIKRLRDELILRHPPRPLEILLRNYLEALNITCNALAFGDPLTGRPGQPMELAHVFTMLRANQFSHDSIISALSSYAAVVLLGQPGGGKSTVLAFLALSLAEAQPEYPSVRSETGLTRLGDTWNTGALLPIRVRLRDVVQNLWEGVPELQHSSLNDAERILLEGYLNKHIDDGTALLLLDGLDEVPLDRLELIQSMLDDIRTRKARMIITCRSFDYHNEPGRQLDLPELELQRFSESAQAEFVDRWYLELVRTGRRSEAEARVKAANLKLALQEREEIADLAGTPLLSALIALVHTEEGELPSARALLYQRCIRLLLWRWRPPIGNDSMIDERRLLTLTEELGYLSHSEEQQKGRAFRGLTRSQIRETAMNFFIRGATSDSSQRQAESQGLIAAHRLLNGNGLLLAAGGEYYTFAHRTFQEFLAGQYLGVGSRKAKALEHASNPHWRIALHLMAGYGAREGNLDYVLLLIYSLMGRDQDTLFLASELLAEIGPATLRDKGYDEELSAKGIWWQIAQKLRLLCFKPSLCPDQRIRNRAAALLDQLDADDRPSLDLESDAYWAARIEPGIFLMGDNQSKWSDEKPAFNCTIQQPYALAVYPVTNRQYLRFLDSLSPQEAEKYRPYSWPGRHYRRGTGNHPVVWIHRENAVAFTVWVDTLLHKNGKLTPNEQVRLPTEKEWERAAAYPVQMLNEADAGRREYPWGSGPKEPPQPSQSRGRGNSDENLRANTSESAIRDTSAVGIFPHGAAACGAEDMSGNVWETCSTIYYPYPLPEDIQKRPHNHLGHSNFVLRGGSWDCDYFTGRCAYRTPITFGDDVGFRLARIFSQ